MSISCREEGDIIANNFDVICYPNPANAELNIEFISNDDYATSIRITDMIGKSMLIQNEHSSPGENKFRLDVAGISSGIYMIEVVNGEQKSVQRIMIE